MKRKTTLLVLGALLAFGCTATRVLHDAEREETREHWDLAVLQYEKAAQIDPESDRIRIALRRARFKAAQAHYERGRIHHAAGQLDLAALELEQSVALDATNAAAQQEMKRVKDEIETRRIETAGGTDVEKAKAKTRAARVTPPMLNPASDKPIDVSFPPDTPIKKIYQALASAAGINVIYDPQLKDDKFTLELRGMQFQKALETVMRQAGHFYKVIDEKTIIIAQDTQQNRKEYEDLVIRTFFLSNGDVKDVSAMVRSILDLRRLGTIPQLNAIVIRDTADKVAVAQRLIEVNDKAKSEVVVDVELIQISLNKLLDLGPLLSSYATTAQATRTIPAPGGSTDTTTQPATALPWNDLVRLGLSDFSFTLPTVTFNFVKQNGDAETLARPQLRIAEGEKAQLTIGDRVPIPVTTFNTSQTVGSNIVPITSFQYQDVGIKIDMEPRVHHNKEVTLKLTVEVSNLGAPVTFGGQSQPTIQTRTITSTIRLKDGETNLLAGLIRKDKTTVRDTVPFFGDIPIIGQLLTHNKNTDTRTDVFLTLTPHIIRSPSITEEDLLPIWVGTENNVSFSGLATRLESPNAPGSPFDQQPVARPVSPRAVPTPPPAGNIGPTPAPRFFGISPNPTPVITQPSRGAVDAPADSGGARTVAAVAAAAPLAPLELKTASGPPTLQLSASAGAIHPGDTATVSLAGVSGLADRGALELTIEWDPTIVEVTGAQPGAWRSADGAEAIRFEADRTPGRARLQFGRTIGSYGLPEGELARLSVRGLSAGTALFHVSTGASAGKGGAAVPRVDVAAVKVLPQG